MACVYNVVVMVSIEVEADSESEAIAIGEILFDQGKVIEDGTTADYIGEAYPRPMMKSGGL